MSSQLFTSQTELEEFAACFSVSRNHKDLRTSIKRLPEHLRYSKTDLVLHKTGYKGNARYNYMDRPSCSVHKRIDSIAVSKVFESLRTELTDAVQEMGKHIDVFGPDECMTVHHVAVIPEMWAKSWPDGISNERWRYQVDQCEACMLSRIATDPSALRELRTLFLAHGRQKLQELNQPQPQPIILTFVDEWIKLTDQARILYDTSEERAREIGKCILDKKLQEAEEKRKKAAEEEAKRKQARNSQGLEILPALAYNPTPPVTQDVPCPLFSSTITRPMSRSEYELTEAQFLREFSPHNQSFYRTSSTIDDDGSSAITNIYSDSDTQTNIGLSKTLADLQKQQIEDQYRTNEGGGRRRKRSSSPNAGLTSRLYGPWSSTDGIRGSYSRFSQTTVSSPGSYRRRSELSPPISPSNESNHPRTPETYNRAPVSPLHNPMTPDRYNMMPVSPPANPRMPQDRYMPPPKTPKTPDKSRMLLPIPDVSPFHVSPFVPASSSRAHTTALSPEYDRVSAFSSGEEVVGQQLRMTKGQGRVVNVRAAREERYMPK
ncbi:Hypothetical protein PENO1_043330 [Penicillium occitanis (nom. inval.)]|nr:Hypothetical protein PENO1_043330 [Penicillium occitanis (nom. inval.)]PCH09691.1 hypothetical protein PENOC_009190 [Penicillium occitanis (nom. inval.)]